MAGFGLVLPKKKVGYTFIGGKHVMNYVITSPDTVTTKQDEFHTLPFIPFYEYSFLVN